MTTLADQLAQALALVSTGALDEDYSKIATAAAVAPPPLDPGRLAEKARRAEVEHAKVLEELPFDVKRGAAFAKFGPVATLDLDGGQDEFVPEVEETPAVSPELF